MATQNQDQLLQMALTEVYGQAITMVRTLAAMQQNLTGPVPAVKNFQDAWNANLAEIRAFIGGPLPEGRFSEIVVAGLKNDARYGVNTATALGGLIYLIGDQFDQLAASVPVSASNIPVWWAQNHVLIEGALMVDFSTMSQGQNSQVELDPGQVTQQVLDQSGSTTQLPQQDDGVVDDMSGDIDFTNDGSTIVSSAKRSGWSVPLWALGFGLLTAGGIVYFVARDKKKRAHA